MHQPLKTLFLSPKICNETKLSPLAKIVKEVKTPDMKRASKLVRSKFDNLCFSEATESNSKTISNVPSIKSSTSIPWINTLETKMLKQSPLLNADAIPTRENSLISSATASGDLSSSQIVSSLALCLCGNQCETSEENAYLPQCSECVAKYLKQSQSGYLYEKEDKALKRYWYVLSGPYLYSKKFCVDIAI
jgi:hypothetical protein